MTVCFISHSSTTRTGAGKALVELVDALKARGVECRVIVPFYGSLAREMKTRGVAFAVSPHGRWVGPNQPKAIRLCIALIQTFLNLAVMIPMAVTIKRWKCDVVYTNTISVCLGALVAKLLGRPHVWHIHEFGPGHHGQVFVAGQKFSLWLMNRLSSIYIANSQAVAEKFRKYLAPAKLRVVYQSVTVGTDLLDEKAANRPAIDQAETDIRCVMVGSLNEQKGQQDAIRAIAELVRSGMRARLVMVGGSGRRNRKYLLELAAQNQCDQYIEYVGHRANPFPFMRSADVVLMCSTYEAFGRVTVEAMRVGKPVIGASNGGTIELIRDGFNGLLYTRGDHHELAQKIRYLCEHPDVARQMGENGRRWAAEQFSEERYGEEVLAILQRLVGSP